ncbi:ABC transporter substrate-binding protein [Hyphococcus sp.]|uniref:ABC transporter substrate-binding protein n=1 Tax=Hyphococcus sp. TaxID=2038636 RepID=UPI002087D73D|nr:MAG: iron ABC transporter substrate-binding protein [Marinicaulis sp.]
MMRTRSIVSILAGAIILAGGASAAKPRAVSLDYCSDQYLLKLADPEQIAAVSRGAGKDYSYMRAAAADFPKIRATLEEAAPLSPDIILRQWGGGAKAQFAFARFGAEVVALGYPEDFDGVKDNIRLVAKALDQPQRGEALIQEMEERLEALTVITNPAADGVHALYVTPGGVTAGAHTMIDAIIRAAGLKNIAAEAGQVYWPALPAEQLLLDPPEIIVSGFFISRDEDVNYWSASRHPVLERLFAKTPTVHLTADLVSCAAWFSIDAAEMIADKAVLK